MRIAVFSTRSYDQEFLSAANASQQVGGHELPNRITRDDKDHLLG